MLILDCWLLAPGSWLLPDLETEVRLVRNVLTLMREPPVGCLVSSYCFTSDVRCEKISASCSQGEMRWPLTSARQCHLLSRLVTGVGSNQLSQPGTAQPGLASHHLTINLTFPHSRPGLKSPASLSQTQTDRLEVLRSETVWPAAGSGQYRWPTSWWSWWSRGRWCQQSLWWRDRETERVSGRCRVFLTRSPRRVCQLSTQYQPGCEEWQFSPETV